MMAWVVKAWQSNLFFAQSRESDHDSHQCCLHSDLSQTTWSSLLHNPFHWSLMSRNPFPCDSLLSFANLDSWWFDQQEVNQWTCYSFQNKHCAHACKMLTNHKQQVSYSKHVPLQESKSYKILAAWIVNRYPSVSRSFVLRLDRHMTGISKKDWPVT